LTDPQKVVGWWYVWVDTYFWTYVFEANGEVRWTDPYNHKSGRGKWDPKGNISIKWSAPSTATEQWGPINPPNQVGTYYWTKDQKRKSSLTAKYIGSRTFGVVKNIVGRWKVRVLKQGSVQWSYRYDFDAGGRVKWTDVANGMTGNGQWTLTKDGLYTWWTGSTTTETWSGPLDGPVWLGTTRIKGVNYNLQADKNG